MGALVLELELRLGPEVGSGEDVSELDLIMKWRWEGYRHVTSWRVHSRNERTPSEEGHALDT